MAGRRRDPALDAAIRASATELLHERGWGGFTVEEVALRVGVPKSTVYKRWSSRVHLASAILDEWLSGMIAQVEAVSESPMGDRLRMLVDVHTAFTSGSEGRAVTEVLVSNVADPVVIDLRKRAGEYLEAFHRVVASVAAGPGTAPDLEVNLMADMVLGAIWLRSLRGLAIDAADTDALLSVATKLLR